MGEALSDVGYNIGMSRPAESHFRGRAPGLGIVFGLERWEWVSFLLGTSKNKL